MVCIDGTWQLLFFFLLNARTVLQNIKSHLFELSIHIDVDTNKDKINIVKPKLL